MTTKPTPGPALEEVLRSKSFTSEATDSDGRTLVGYAAVFGESTRINSTYEGVFDEVIKPGAFKRSLASRVPKMQFDHGNHPLIGSIPIGTITDIREDPHGLHVEARISDNWLMQPIRDAIAEGSVDGMSFKFEVVQQEWHDKQGKRISDPKEIQRMITDPPASGALTRTLVEVRIPEAGPVVWPAYQGTEVSVRAREAARSILTDEDTARQVIASLRADIAGEWDDDTRDEVAVAVLLGDRTELVGESGPEVFTPTEVEREQAPSPETREDAPLPEHAPATTDGPLPEHPSSPEARRKYARLSYVTSNGVGSRY